MAAQDRIRLTAPKLRLFPVKPGRRGSKSIREWAPALMDWVVLLGKPLLLGMFLLALLLSLAGYLLVRGGWRLYTIHEWRKRAKRRAAIKRTGHME